jgi:hypothetical protein
MEARSAFNCLDYLRRPNWLFFTVQQKLKLSRMFGESPEGLAGPTF